jgi:hypothetical protein
MALRFSNSHFYVQNFRFRALFCPFTAIQAEIRKKYLPFDVNPRVCYIPKMTFLTFRQKKPCIKTSKNTIFGIFNQQKSKKNSYHSLKFRQFSGFSSNLSCLTAVNQMVGGSDTELTNGIARSSIDLSYVLMRNVLPLSV